MRCYNCGCELSEHSFCTNCGVDVVLYKKIIRTSNYFYNQGLERARVRDLSGAIVSLRESLKFNKNNIKARNLLGLVYYEQGEIPAALSEWVISKNLRSKKNLAADYIERVQSNPSKLEAIENAIKKYNVALEYCKQPESKGIDMAVIQLKKVAAQNPNFVRAHQLLALCYLAEKKPELAKRTLEQCRKVDVNNTMTLRYLDEAENMLHPADDKKKAAPKQSSDSDTVTYTVDNETIIQPVGLKDHRGSNTILNIIIGIAIGFSVAFFLVLPARIQKEKAAAQETVKSIDTQLDAKNIAIGELEQTVSDQKSKIAALTESINAYAGTEGTLLSMENLLKASAIYLENQENFLEVADYISEVDESNWTDETSENYKKLYYALKAAVGPNVAKAYYQEAYSAYRSKEYPDAIAYLESAVFFDSANADALYLLAQSYNAAEKTEEAKIAYNKVIELFPGTWQAGNSKTALKKME
ncbi:MAG: tetratricopeptide repeat protein [Lachnospiraceae bacterium]|nr:tetratricopeptide repeat protein [Lachnospiraceae bacterium]